ncbi:hypothetical protein QBC45DRAFT_195817 [Copromyces sp. CBS 386.78]|nr:hypothetical protein QBC45DRAFT_195817 [Copromyces sp. CBS 386.78]
MSSRMCSATIEPCKTVACQQATQARHGEMNGETMTSTASQGNQGNHNHRTQSEHGPLLLYLLIPQHQTSPRLLPRLLIFIDRSSRSPTCRYLRHWISPTVWTTHRPQSHKLSAPSLDRPLTNSHIPCRVQFTGPACEVIRTSSVHRFCAVCTYVAPPSKSGGGPDRTIERAITTQTRKLRCPTILHSPAPSTDDLAHQMSG